MAYLPTVLGHQVELEYSAFTWDGASTETTEFSSGSLSFLVGEEQVTSGLDLAVQQLKKGDQVGQGSYITLLPHLLPKIILITTSLFPFCFILKSLILYTCKRMHVYVCMYVCMYGTYGLTIRCCSVIVRRLLFAALIWHTALQVVHLSFHHQYHRNRVVGMAASGYPPSVPPNSNVVYKVRVLSIKSSLIASASATSMPRLHPIIY